MPLLSSKYYDFGLYQPSNDKQGCGLTVAGRWAAHAAMAQNSSGGIARTETGDGPGYLADPSLKTFDPEVQKIWEKRQSIEGWEGDKGSASRYTQNMANVYDVGEILEQAKLTRGRYFGMVDPNRLWSFR